MKYILIFLWLQFIIFSLFAQQESILFSPKKSSNPENKSTTESKVPFLKVQGSVLYNFTYQSYIDTPFTQKGLLQHLTQVSLNATIKDKYPVKVLLSNRTNNSPYFKNITDVNFQLDRSSFLNNVKEGLKAKALKAINAPELSQLENLYNNQLQKIQELQSWLNDPARIQELVGEKEKELRGKMEDVRSKIGDSARSTINSQNPVDDQLLTVSEQFTAKKEELAKLQSELKQYNDKIQYVKKGIQDSINTIKNQINRLSSAKGVVDFMKENNISKNALTKGQRLLLSINKIGLGRSWIDYSELTVKNISLTGVNIEMNPSNFYFAAAAGKLNYRFRDFVIKNNNALPNQSLYLVRAGVGQKEKNNFIVTFYNGEKSILNYSQLTKNITQRVIGIAAEARFSINENNYVIAEIAKSSFNGNADTKLSSSQLVKKATDLKIHNNQAYSVKLFSQYPQTNTKLTAFYRKTGENFQSFNLYPINTNQDAWSVKVSQGFWRKRLKVEAGIRKNDFTSPIAAPNFSSETIFKSFQASLQIPKYPFVMVGYYPSSQLSLTNNDVLTENQYNTLNAVINHSYTIKNLSMNTNAMFTKFYNNSNDSSFIYFNASSYTVNHSVFLSSLTLQCNASLSEQKDLHLLTLEQSLNYSFKNKISVGGGVKYNRLNHAKTLFGANSNIGLTVEKLGTIQINYDKMYLPGSNKGLIPVDMGRLSFYRSF